MEETVLARGLRMAHPRHPERLPRLTRVPIRRPVCRLYHHYKIDGVRHMGLMRAHYDLEDDFPAAYDFALSVAARERDADAVSWFMQSHRRDTTFGWEREVELAVIAGDHKWLDIILTQIKPRLVPVSWIMPGRADQQDCLSTVMAYYENQLDR
jgi:hypothetical protein